MTNNEHIKIDWNTSRDILEREMEKNNSEALFYAALHFSMGSNGFDEDRKKQVELYMKAATFADHGLPAAQMCRGICYNSGYDVETDLREAVRWFRMAAEQNFAPAQNALGFAYFKGDGIGKDDVEAFKWMQKAAEQGDLVGQLRLGIFYIEGVGIEKDEASGLHWLSVAAEQGFAPAAKALESAMQNNESKEDRFARFREAAEGGEPQAQCRLARCYYDGEGIDENKEEAYKWFRKAAESGDAEAQTQLGLHYLAGDEIERDAEKGIEWLHKAAEQGGQVSAYAAYVLFRCYYSGSDVEQDRMEAIKWLKMSGEQGYAEAQCALGACYESGEDVEKDDIVGSRSGCSCI